MKGGGSTKMNSAHLRVLGALDIPRTSNCMGQAKALVVPVLRCLPHGKEDRNGSQFSSISRWIPDTCQAPERFRETPKKRGLRMPQEVRRHLPHIDAGRIGMAPRPLLGDLWPWYAWILDVSRKPPTLTMEKMSEEPT